MPRWDTEVAPGMRAGCILKGGPMGSAWRMKRNQRVPGRGGKKDRTWVRSRWGCADHGTLAAAGVLSGSSSPGSRSLERWNWSVVPQRGFTCWGIWGVYEALECPLGVSETGLRCHLLPARPGSSGSACPADCKWTSSLEKCLFPVISPGNLSSGDSGLSLQCTVLPAALRFLLDLAGHLPAQQGGKHPPSTRLAHAPKGISLSPYNSPWASPC